MIGRIFWAKPYSEAAYRPTQFQAVDEGTGEWSNTRENQDIRRTLSTPLHRLATKVVYSSARLGVVSATCLFCDRSEDLVELSEDHITPKWLLHELKLPSHDKTFHGVWDSASGTLVEKKVQSSWRFVEERVCKLACNNGWMSRLEGDVIRFLPLLGRGERDLTTLLPNERRSLAKWAAKTAYLHTTAGLLGKPVATAHIHALNTDLGLLAPRVVVFASQGNHRRPSSYVQTGLWPQQTLVDPGATSPDDAYKIGLQYQRLALLVAYWPQPTAQLMPASYQFPVWTEGWTLRPWAGLVYETAPEEILMFANDLGVFESPHVIIPRFGRMSGATR